MKTGRSYMPSKWQAFEVQEGEGESEELPDASLACEAEVGAQSGQCRWHCWGRAVDFVRRWYVVKTVKTVEDKKGLHELAEEAMTLLLEPLPAQHLDKSNDSRGRR